MTNNEYEKALNSISTWNQGYFVKNKPHYRNYSEETINEINSHEHLLVRPSPTGNALCQTFYPDDSKWIAKRLNIASHIELILKHGLILTKVPDYKEIVEKINGLFKND